MSRWAPVTSGPISFSGSVPGPTLSARTLGASFSISGSADCADGDGDRDGHAALASGSIGRAHQPVDRLVEVGVRHDDQVVLRAAQRLDALAGVRGGPVDVLGDRGGADEAHRRDVGMGEDGVHRLGVAVDDVQHALGQAGLGQQLGEAQRAGRVLLRRLQDERVAAGDRHRKHPHRHHGREVERGDAGAHAERLAQRPAIHAGADRLGELALQEMRDAAGELDHLEPAHQRAARVRQHLAVLGGDHRGQLVGVLLDQLLELEHDAGTAQRRRGGPAGEGLARGRDRRVDLGAVAKATRFATSPVAGLNTSPVRPPAPATVLPAMKCPIVSTITLLPFRGRMLTGRGGREQKFQVVPVAGELVCRR